MKITQILIEYVNWNIDAKKTEIGKASSLYKRV